MGEERAGRWSSIRDWLPIGESRGGWRWQIDPGTGDEVGRVADQTPGDVDAHLREVRTTYTRAPRLTAGERAALLRECAARVEALASDLGEVDSLCTGKLRAVSTATALSGAQVLRYYADLVEEFPLGGALAPIGPGSRQWVDRLPVGMVACILPWNFPLSQGCARLAMLFASGNAAVFKASELAQPPLLALEQVAAEAGLPRWAFSVVTGGPDAGRALVESRWIDGVCFTGGIGTGVAIAQTAMTSLKRLVLELGGRTPNVFFADATGERAVAGAVAAGFGFQGQACTAGAELIVEEAAFDEFVAATVDRASKLRVGHQLADETEFGPMISARAVQRIEAAVAEAVEQGANVLTGGTRLSTTNGGFYYAPTVITDVPAGCALLAEEVFGPVVAARRFCSEAELADQINDSSFGLAAAVWGRDLERVGRFAENLRVGVTYINCHGQIARNAPWGGFRMSGLGRLYGTDGLLAFTDARQTYQSLESL
jgi:acyl-CoA reductase-like NAD-dependent aldehyde dehydrogenase